MIIQNYFPNLLVQFDVNVKVKAYTSTVYECVVRTALAENPLTGLNGTDFCLWSQLITPQFTGCKAYTTGGGVLRT